MRRAAAIRAALTLGLLCLLCQGASASHYRLPAGGLATKAETSALAVEKVKTTKQLLHAAAKAKARRALAKATGIPANRLLEMVSLCDLLRVDGIGPSVARLLRASAVPWSRVAASALARSLATSSL